MLIVAALLGCSKAEPRTADSLELSIRNILEMPTCEQIYRDIIYIGEEQKVLFIKTIDKRLLFSIDIKIQAGIKQTDEIRISLEGDRDNGKTGVIVTMPKAEILLVDADEKSIEQYFIKEWGGDISRLEYYDEIKRKKEELIKEAQSGGLLDRAETNAEKLIRNFLILADVEVIEFRKADNEI
jgi:hypothetical protein